MPHYCLQFFQAHLVQIFRAERVSESVRENVRDLIIRVLLVILLLSSRHFRRNVLAYHRFSILCKEQKTAISTYHRFFHRCITVFQQMFETIIGVVIHSNTAIARFGLWQVNKVFSLALFQLLVDKDFSDFQNPNQIPSVRTVHLHERL